MLDIESALELMKKYGYSSTNTHPYLYQSGESVGICYTYVDEEFGALERVKIFDSLEGFEEFLKQMDWLKKNGLNYSVRMCLDNYEAINPKVLFLRKEKLMIEGEMDDVENFDMRDEQRDQMDMPSQILYEAGDLLLIYDEVKKRQLQYLLKIIGLKNQLRQKYFDLQKAVDEYNKIKIDREIVKIPEVPDNGGIDIQMEIALKDRYNIYVREVPSLEEVTAFLKDVWQLNKSLEMNTRYYDALREETEIRNEMKIVEKKLEFMNNLNENIKPIFGVDLVGKFKKINKNLGSTINSVSTSIVEERITQVEDKYKYYDKLDLLYVSDYLREAIQNSNYDDLSIKYEKGTTKEIARRARTPLNVIASNLLVQFKNSLTVDEQAILVIYSNPKYRMICDAILSIPRFNTFTIKQIIKKISNIKGFSKLKSECYINLKARIDDPLNAGIKASLFHGYDFSTFETFIASLVGELTKLKSINNKMYLTGDINMYLPVNKVEDVKSREFVLVSNDIATLSLEAKKNRNMIGITLLKENLPVLYSPYYLDLGEIYDKNASPKIEIREMINFELLVDASDIIINIDKSKVNVVNYYSDLSVEGNVTLAKDIKSSGKTIFVKYAFLPNTQVLGDLPVREVINRDVLQEQNVVVDNNVAQGILQDSVPMDVSAPVLQNQVEETPQVAQELEPSTEPVTVSEDVNQESVDVQTEMEATPQVIQELEPSTEPEVESKDIVDTKEKVVDSSSDNEENLDKLLDTIATTMPKDNTKNLEDTNKMEIFADLVDKKEENEKAEEIQEKNSLESPEKKPVKTQIVKKIITKPDGSKKVVMVRRVLSSNADLEKTGVKPVKKIVKKVIRSGASNTNKVIDSQLPNNDK